MDLDVLSNQNENDTILLGTLMGLNEVQEQLASYGIPSYKLDKSYVEISVKSRILFLKDLLNELERKE